MEWNEETIQRLRGFWSEGISTAEIGRRLGVSKNAVVGKAHRLELSARPSPIHWDNDTPRARRRRPATAPRPSGPTLPPLPSLPVTAAAPRPAPVVPRPAPAPVVASRALPVVPAQAPPRPTMAQMRPAAPAARLATVPPARNYGGRIVTCCWPLGEPGTKDFHFCDAASTPGKPYCEAHAQIAYVKVRDRREDAA